jgi:hypothetical protein
MRGGTVAANDSKCGGVSVLGVELQQVVLGKARDRSATAEALMGAMMVVGMEPGQQSVGALVGMIVGTCVCPFAQSKLLASAFRISDRE